MIAMALRLRWKIRHHDTKSEVAMTNIEGHIATAGPNGSDQVRLDLDSGPVVQIPKATFVGLMDLFGDRLGEVLLRFHTGWLSRYSKQTTVMSLPAGWTPPFHPAGDMLVLAVADRAIREQLQSVLDTAQTERVTDLFEMHNYRISRYLGGVLAAGPNEAYQPDRTDAAEVDRFVEVISVVWPTLAQPGVLSFGPPLLHGNIGKRVTEVVDYALASRVYAPSVGLRRAPDAWKSFDEPERKFVQAVGRLVIPEWRKAIHGLDPEDPGQQAVVGFAELSKRIAASRARAEARTEAKVRPEQMTNERLVAAQEALALPSEDELQSRIEESATDLSQPE